MRSEPKTSQNEPKTIQNALFRLLTLEALRGAPAGYCCEPLEQAACCIEVLFAGFFWSDVGRIWLFCRWVFAFLLGPASPAGLETQVTALPTQIRNSWT